MNHALIIHFHSSLITWFPNDLLQFKQEEKTVRCIHVPCPLYGVFKVFLKWFHSIPFSKDNYQKMINQLQSIRRAHVQAIFSNRLRMLIPLVLIASSYLLPDAIITSFYHSLYHDPKPVWPFHIGYCWQILALVGSLLSQSPAIVVFLISCQDSFWDQSPTFEIKRI